MSNTEEAVRNLMHSYEVTTIDAAKVRWKDNDNVLHPRLCRHMVEWIADPENEVTGEADDYYRLVSAAFETSDYLSAVRIAEIGLAKYPYNVDLLAFAVRVSGRAGDFEKGEGLECLSLRNRDVAGGDRPDDRLGTRAAGKACFADV